MNAPSLLEEALGIIVAALAVVLTRVIQKYFPGDPIDLTPDKPETEEGVTHGE